MTKEEKQKAIDALKISTPNMPVTQEKFMDYVQIIHKIIDWLEQEPCDDAISRLTPSVLADMLMEERIRGALDYDTTFEKDIIDDVKCRLTVSIRDHRPCYCGAGLREVWRESEE